jgi:hypothetical protein
MPYTNKRLGCLPHDPAVAASLPQIGVGAAALLPRVVPPLDWTPTLGDNETEPTCVPTAYINATRASMRYLGGGDIQVSDAEVRAQYARAIGRPGATPAELAATDGCDPLAFMAMIQTDGWWTVGLQAPLVPTYGAITNLFRGSMARVIGEVGAVMLAVTLYEQDMETQVRGAPWTGLPTGEPIGGHMIAACSYSGLQDQDTLKIATWGVWQPATWEWIAARIQLGIATITRDLLPPAASARYAMLADEMTRA